MTMLDAARQILQPLLNTNRQDVYLGGAARRAEGLQRLLDTPQYRASAAVKELAEAVGAFAQRQRKNGAALDIGTPPDEKLSR